MLPLAILVAGEPVAGALAARGTFPDIIRATVGNAWPGPWREIDARGGFPAPERIAGLIITGSSANVPDREPWVLAVERYLARIVPLGLPVLGICFGHQLLGQALGGEVQRNPRGREIGTVELQVFDRDPLFAEVPPAFAVNVTHVDSVTRLPPGARVLARTELEPHAAVYFGERTWGVQFHPEMDGEILKHYVVDGQGALEREGLDAPSVLASARDTPHSAGLLRRFVARELAKTS